VIGLAFLLAVGTPAVAFEATVSGDREFRNSAVAALKKCGFQRIRVRRGPRLIDSVLDMRSEQFSCAATWLQKHFPNAPIQGSVEMITY
jgi:hypothetical protein